MTTNQFGGCWKEHLKKAELDVKLFESASIAMQALERDTPQVIITDVRMPGIDGFQFLENVQTQHPEFTSHRNDCSLRFRQCSTCI
jgi:DNA-binding NtrC family response regulator